MHAVNQAARQNALRTGMAVSQAQALVPDLLIHDADPPGDDDALSRLAVWALHRYSPLVAADAPDGLVLDTTGADHLHAGEQIMLAGMLTALQKAGIAARAAVAGTWGAAHALARFTPAKLTIGPPGRTGDLIRDLPLAALRLDHATVQALRTLGFDTIGELDAQPRAPLALRFGPQIGRRLDQAMGRVDEPIVPVRPPDVIEVSRNFAEPIGAPETIARYITQLVTDLCAELEARRLGARIIDLLYHRVDSQMGAQRVALASPIRDAKRLTRLLCDRIVKIEPGFGIEVLSLVVAQAEPLGSQQRRSSLVDAPGAEIGALVDVLANRVGHERLYRLAPVASDVPERAVRRVEPMAAPAGAFSIRWPRPTRLLSHPERIDTVALLPDHPPVSFTWRGIRRRVKRADGPERIFGEWWKRDAELAAVRDYFQVEDEAGERFWIYRQGDGEHPATGSHDWFIHGIFG